MNSTADDDRACSSVPSFPTDSVNISSINLNDYEMINSNNTSDNLSSSGISREVIRNVPVTKNSTLGDTVDGGERMEEEDRIKDSEEKEDVGHVEGRENVKDDDGNEGERIEEEESEEITKQEEEEDNQYEANSKENETSQYDPSILPSSPFTQSPNATIQPKKKPRRHHIQKVLIDTTLPVQPVLADSRHSSHYSLVLFTTADSHPVYHYYILSYRIINKPKFSMFSECSPSSNLYSVSEESYSLTQVPFRVLLRNWESLL